MKRLPMSALAVAALASACVESFDPRHELERYQVLGLVADRPQPGPDDAVRLTVYDHVPAGESASYAWTVCLYSLGPAVGYACAAPQLELPLEADGPEATLDLGPDGLNLRAHYEQTGPLPGPDGEPVTLEDGIALWVKLTSGPRGEVQSVKKVVVREGGEPNRNPVVVDVKVDGVSVPADAPLAVKAGQAVVLSVQTSADSVERYVDGEGEARDEELLYTWFATDGRLTPGITFGDDVDTELELPDEAGEVTVYVAVRDGRGGLAVAERRLTVTR